MSRLADTTPVSTSKGRTSMSATERTRTRASLQSAFKTALARELSQAPGTPSKEAILRAAAHACRDLLNERWVSTQQQDNQRGEAAPVRRVHYLSMEFLMGRALGNALAALGLDKVMQEALDQHAGGVALGDVIEREPDAALGNGGLGRLAACFLDSFAELGLPSFGYGLRYQYGMFAQGIDGGRQVESPDDWMRMGAPWEIIRPERRYPVRFGGRVVSDSSNAGHAGGRRWVGGEVIMAQAYDFIVPAHHSERVSTLRQWHASSANPIDFQAFCRGDYIEASRHRVAADALNWVLYPDDSTEAGRELRLKQEAFLVSASLQDLIARHLREYGTLLNLGKLNAIHLNDTHPALAPAELMRLLVDEHALSWDAAWKITRQAVSYTNHTLMPEALETWPVRMFEALLPRHLEIIYEINHHFLEEVKAKAPGDTALLRRVSIIDEGSEHGGNERRVRMAALSIVASHRVNGVAKLHSDLCVQTIFADYACLYPDRFHNVTNGVTPRRWLAQANPGLSNLLDAEIGRGWRKNLADLSKVGKLAGDAELQRAFQAVKRENKEKLAALIRTQLGTVVNPASLFDVQIKRIHEYKRQLLNILHVIARYQAILASPNKAPDGLDWVPRTVVIAGKAASAYHMAKLIIQLAHDVARVVNSDPRVGDKLKLVYLPNYGVSLAETIIPAADLSEQISTAGTEASGTGNMKFALNGAITIGTWDGANIEMAEAMGVLNMFVFGLRAEGVQKMKQLGYDPKLYIEENRQLKAVMDAIGNGTFSSGDPERYRAIVDNLTHRDGYMLMADFADYVAAQSRVDALFRQSAAWSERAIRNVAGMGWFSSDRTIAEYVERVWSLNSLG
ncbi:glycogen/starch/alpha-glucan phosphorylase [Inhella crocodyli]|nr:glycogen/starch/alpha-glucan phosphorylase [Inhella crocodyli]